MFYYEFCEISKSTIFYRTPLVADSIQESSYDAPQDMEKIVIDGPALVHMNPSKHSKTFREYCTSELGEKMKRIAAPVNQLDLVSDVCRENGLKAETREGRENAARVSSIWTTIVETAKSGQELVKCGCKKN